VARRNELSQWNLHNAVIKAKIDCRLHENLIYAAQKLKLQPDEKMERNLDNLKSVAAKITQEIHLYVQERGQYVWRYWHGGDPDWLNGLKQKYGGGELTFTQLLEIYYSMYRETNRWESRYDELMSDERMMNMINGEMKSFFSNELGAKTWILVNNVVANKGANM
jgi:hypothetical protein